MMLQILWFKRDLRLEDHAALYAAARAGRVLPLIIIEPDYWKLPDVSSRQWKFLKGCIEDLGRRTAEQGGKLIVRVGDVVGVLEALKSTYGQFVLWAHEETGNAWTFDRDKGVRLWCRANGIVFQEKRQFGVIRAQKVNRNHWSSQWDKMMALPLLPLPSPLTWEFAESDALPECADLGLADDGLVTLPEAGQEAAMATLYSFLHERGEHYTREMSSPVSGEGACSRLSWHIAYGTLSVREITQSAWARYRELPPHEKAWRQALRSFIARLHWHCHFIQKLESEPEAEWRPIAKIYEGVRPRPADPDRLTKWSEGRTGYPFIDAAMRYLNANGWINFRMRAMLMSFASYDLWLPWQESGLVLARKFIDYEPGIHWPQCQMQAGETGINTIRIYSPVKQGYDQDPDGAFIRKWVPELADMPDGFVHEPWKMVKPPSAYPMRIVDHAIAAKEAKDRLYSLRRKPEARAEAKIVVDKHGSRKRMRDHIVSGKLAATSQLSLDI